MSTIGQVTSRTIGVACGVCWWSMLEPNLFLLYMNDIFTVSQSLKVVSFAVDAKI